MNGLTKLHAEVAALATARATTASLKAERDAILAACRKYQALLPKITEAQAEEDAARTALDTVAADLFRHTGEKQLHPAVSIAIKREVAIGDAALPFAQLHVPKAVIVDAKAFTKAVLAFVEAGVDVPPNAATISETPQVRVKTDLSAYVE